MTATERSVIYSAVGVLALLIFLGIFTSYEDAAVLKHLQTSAYHSGEQDANRISVAGERYFLAVSHGWGLDEVPGIEAPSVAKCIIRNLSVRKFRELTDIPVHETLQARVDALINTPNLSLEYAAGFNSVMYQVFDAEPNTCF